jgi:predicted nucleic acid-binding Zn ribbon protein
MTTPPSASGADLARQALAAARANARNTPAQAPRKTRRTMRVHRGEHGDPQGLGNILDNLTATQGWDTGLDGGNLIDQWTTIAPTELATTVQPVAYDPERGILQVRPSSPAYATQVRMFQQQLAKHLNTQLGRPAVRTIRVLAPSAAPAAGLPEPEQPKTMDAPVKTRGTASPGYRAALEAALANRPEKQPGNPYVAEADARQVAALRANRQPETDHQDAVWAQADAEQKAGPKPGSMEASERAARAYARRAAGGRDLPRAFDVA